MKSLTLPREEVIKRLNAKGNNLANYDRLRFSADGSLLAAGEVDTSTVTVWNVGTGKRLNEFTKVVSGAPIGFMTERGSFTAGPSWRVSAFSPDGRLLGVGETMKQGSFGQIGSGNFGGLGTPVTITTTPATEHRIVFYDLARGKEIADFGKISEVQDIAFSPDGRTLATAEIDGVVRLWEVATRQERAVFRGHVGAATALAFSPDGRTLASGGADTTVLLWNLFASSSGRSANERPSDDNLKQWWASLAEPDAAKAYQATGQLVQNSRCSLPYLKERLQPANSDTKRIAALIVDLGSNMADTREKASAALADLGEEAIPDLKKALAGKPQLEVRRRIEQILEKGPTRVPTGERLQAMRALELLEFIGDEPARRLVETLSTGAANAQLTRDAGLVRDRLARQSLEKP